MTLTSAACGHFSVESFQLPHEAVAMPTEGDEQHEAAMEPLDKASKNFWVVSPDDKDFWDAYVGSRPQYSPEFFQTIFDHHSKHSNSWEVSHDIGCGAGQAIPPLRSHFGQVVASDLSGAHVKVAQERLAKSGVNGGVKFVCMGGEDINCHFPPASADLIAVGEALPLMDTEKAMDSFATTLRPGGTFATWFYGRPTFSDPIKRNSLQPIIDRAMAYSWRKAFDGSSRDRLAGIQMAASCMASWLDDVHFDPKVWQDVHRIKWNPSMTLPFFDERCAAITVSKSSRVLRHEKMEEREDLTWWHNEWSARQIEDYFRVLYPGFREALSNDSTVKDFLTELKQRLGGEDVVSSFTWPAVLLLATKI